MVDVDTVLVERATPDIVLGTEFAMGRHTGLALYQFFHRVAGRCGFHLHVLGLQFLCLSALDALPFHLYLAERSIVAVEHHRETESAFRIAQYAGLAFVTYH